MERIGEITAVGKGWLQVTFCRATDCGECHACMGTKKETTVRVKGEGNVGDAAVITMPTSVVMKASASAYAFPLAGLLAGMILGSVLFPGHRDAAGAIGALVGLGISLGVLFLTESRRRKNPQWTPTLKEILPHTEYINIPKGMMNDGK